MKIYHSTTPAYQLNIGHTAKFKTVKIQITFNNDLAANTVTKRALLPDLLKSVSQKYPTRKEMSIQLESMYSASFNVGVKKMGLAHEIIFDLTVIHNDYALESDNLLEEAFLFLHEILFQPRFSESIFLEEKRLLEEYFLSIYGNKMKYAMIQCNDAMYRDEVFRLQAMGQKEDVEHIQLEDCIQAYNEMLTNDKISINVVGDVTVEDIQEQLDKHLYFTPRTKSIQAIDQTPKPQRSPQTIVDKQDVQQGKVVFAYQFPVYYLTDDYYAAVAFNMILGGSPESMLFKRIREELNKVYFIGSAYDQHKGQLMIYAGINPLDFDEVQLEIEHLIQSIVEQTYTPMMLDIAKKVLINSLIESFDSPGALASRINHLALFGRTFNQEELIAKLEQVSQDDIAKVCQRLTLDTIYFLRNDDHE